jgi:coatomer subunit beta
LVRAVGVSAADDFSSRLKRLVQLSGLSDPIYAEAVVTVHQFDIVLDVTVANQTDDTLQAVTVDFSTVGDLKLVERPQPFTLGPRQSREVHANIKVSSTENGVIYGNVAFENSGDVLMLLFSDASQVLLVVLITAAS